MNINKENDILETTLSIAENGYSEAYHFLQNAYQENSQNYGPQTLYFLACLAGGADRSEEALEWLRKAIHDNKWWYRPEVLEDDDLVALKNDKEFLLLKENSDDRYAQAVSKAKALFSWEKKTANTLFLAVHGNTQNSRTARADWEPIVGESSEWQIETVQSAEPDGYGTYRWSYDMTSYLPVARSMEKVQNVGYQKIACGGFSAGCDMLLRAITFTSARCNLLILQSPWIPALQEHTDALVRAISQKNIELRIYCGSEDGKSIRTQPLECKRSFAYIPDNPDLYDYMTGIKYLNFIADIFEVSVAERRTRIHKYGDLFELTDDLAQPIAAYSHGMKQKLAIISAWLHQPKLILMDEPFVGLDPKASHLLKGMMREVCDAGGAIFFSTHATVYGARIKGAVYPVYLFGSVGVGDATASVIVSVVVVVLFGLMWLLLSHSFLQITTSTGKVVRREYRETCSRQRGLDVALLLREFSHFTTSPNYMLNCGLGTFLMPICAIVMLWKGSELFAALDAMFAETAGSVPLLLCVVLCGLASMNFMTAPSISLEGKSLWLMQSLPVEPRRIFRAKIRMQLLLTGLPLLLCIVCTTVVYPMHLLQLLMILLFSGSYALLMALVGLFLGVKMPTLTWTNEIMPIKQGALVVLTLFGGLGYMVLLFVGFMLLPGWMLGFCGYMSCFVLANVFLSVWFYFWLRERGVGRFAVL